MKYNEQQIKLNLLAKLVKMLSQAKTDFEQSKLELNKVQAGLLTLKALFSDDDNKEILKKIDEIIESVNTLEPDNVLIFSSFKERNNLKADLEAGLLRPSLSEIKDIAYKIIRNESIIPNTSKLKEAFNNEGYAVNLNSLRTILTKNKDLFVFSQARGGWTLTEYLDNDLGELNLENF